MMLLRQNLLKNCGIHPETQGETKTTQSEGLFLSSGAFLSLFRAAVSLMWRRAFIFACGAAASAAMLHHQG